MFCKYCGKELDERAVICPGCGIPVDGTKPAEKKGTNPYAIVGFVLSFFLPLVGLILSVIGLKESKETGANRGFSIAGIVLGAVGLGAEVLTSILFLPAVFTLFL